MLTPETLPHLQVLLEEQNLDGWLLFDFKGRKPIAVAMLGKGIIGTRRVFVFIPRSGVPIALIHEIDAELAQLA
jgi:Xaa-Pro dipeptidase